MRKCDLGCGTAKVEGAIGVDKFPLDGVDVVADLEHYPYPFADHSFDEIYLNDIIEHIPNTIKAMEEIYRIARPNAHVFIRVVNWNSHYTAMDPTHVKAFTEHSFDFFGKRKARSYYSHARFDVVKIDYEFSHEATFFFRNKRLMKFLSTYLCNVLEGLHFDLQALKPGGLEHQGEEEPLFSVLRCPSCIMTRPAATNGALTSVNDKWLICATPECQQKYPIIKGTPILVREEGERWKTTPASALPEPMLPASMRVEANP